MQAHAMFPQFLRGLLVFRAASSAVDFFHREVRIAPPPRVWVYDAGIRRDIKRG
jgi:hypothetical protein